MGSVVDVTCLLGKETSYEEICALMQKHAEGDMAGILGYTDKPLVSSDFERDHKSCVFDAGAGIMLNPKFVKVIAWYNNTWGYSSRLVDLLKHMAKVDADAGARRAVGCSPNPVPAMLTSVAYVPRIDNVEREVQKRCAV